MSSAGKDLAVRIAQLHQGIAGPETMHFLGGSPGCTLPASAIGGDVMRGAAVLIAYLLGLGAMISFGIAGLMALQSSTKSTEPVAAVAPHKEPVASPDQPTTQKDAQSNQKRKTVHATRKRKEGAPIAPSGLDAYGFANERRFSSPFFWGR